MELQHLRCAGLDVHKDTVVACARIAADHKFTVHLETFPTTTDGLLALANWLESHQINHVAMEATGVYWKPVWHILESSFELLLANPQHIKSVPGRKTDMKDAQWIADLHAHGLIKASFVPPEPIQDLRDLTRTRKQLVRETVQHTQRIQKVLQDCNIKLDSVLSDIMGKSGRTMLRAIIRGEINPARLAELACGTARNKMPQLQRALRGNIRDHHRGLLEDHLDVIEFLEAKIAKVDERLGKALGAMKEQRDRLTTIPGVSDLVALTIIAEIGTDMSKFPTADHLVSWAGLCPRNDESAGKRRSTRLRKGGAWLKPMVVQAAWAASRTKGTYLQAQFNRLTRRGPKKAIVAVAASILTAAYYILRDDVTYVDLGADYFNKRDEARVVARLAKRIRDLGYTVEPKKAA